MHSTEVTLISNQFIEIPELKASVNIHDIRSIVVKDLQISEIVLHSGVIFKGLEYLPKDMK